MENSMGNIVPILPGVCIYLQGVSGWRRNIETLLISEMIRSLFDEQDIRSRIRLFEEQKGISCKPYDAGVSCIGMEPHQRITWQFAMN